MIARQYHRDWLHAIEDDVSVPDYAVFCARIYADFAARSADGVVQVRWSMLLHLTHMRREKAARALAWLTEHKWLEEEPGADGQPAKRGQVVRRRLRMPPEVVPTPEPVPDAEPVPEPVPASEPEPVPASEPEPVPASELRTYRTSRTVKPTSLSPRGLHAALAEVVPDVTERESDLIRQLIGRRPGVVSAAAVMRTEIQSGNGPDLVAQVRRAKQRTAKPGPQTSACRSGAHPRGSDPPCMSWCSCTCHA